MRNLKRTIKMNNNAIYVFFPGSIGNDNDADNY